VTEGGQAAPDPLLTGAGQTGVQWWPQTRRGGETMARVRPARNWESWFLAHVGAQVKAITEAIADDARAGCPVDSGDLVSTIGTRYPGGLRGVVKVGGRGVLAHDVNYWAAQEYGAAPHWIESHGPWSLHDPETGAYFGRKVWHPGSQAQPFMRPALYRRRRLTRARVGAITAGLR